MTSQKPVLIFLMGPTASGKTDVAIELVKHFSCEIISVDSAMVYRGMDIGTAKPDLDVLSQAPHRLIDICEPTDTYSAAQFRVDALNEIEQIVESGHTPLLTGGTMLYFNVLQQGLSKLPSANPAIRDEIEAQAKQLGWQAMHERLQKVDSETANRIHANDTQRIQRALEVFQITGKAISEHYKEQSNIQLPYRVIKLILAPHDRRVLHDRIALRFQYMLEQGFVAEVEKLFAQPELNLSLPSMRAVGYRQIWEFLAGERSFDSAVEKGITATRQLAKRQLTWLRAEKQAEWFDAADKKVLERVLKSLKSVQIV